MRRPRHAPLLLLAGGAGSSGRPYAGLLRDLLRGTGKRAPRVAYVGVASDDDPRFLRFMSGLFPRGACQLELAPLAGREPDLARARAVLEAADLVFLGGGDVDLGMRRLCEAGAVSLLREKRSAGAAFAGVSAGAILLCRSWVRWPDASDDSTAEPFDCLGLAPLYCDTHGEEDGWEELKALLRRLPGRPRGFGIRSGAAAGVGADGGLSVLAGEVEEIGGS